MSIDNTLCAYVKNHTHALCDFVARVVCEYTRDSHLYIDCGIFYNLDQDGGS